MSHLIHEDSCDVDDEFCAGSDDNDYICSCDSDSDSDDGEIIHRNYCALKEEDIRRRQEVDVNTVSSVLSVPKESALLLLLHYQWNSNTVNDEWFANEEKIRKAVGLLEKPIVQIPNGELATCEICFDQSSVDRMPTGGCGHPYCESCWERYLSTSIDEGPGCLTLRCPEPSCSAAIGQGMIERLVSEIHKNKYRKYLIRSYVEVKKKIKWCPSPDCEFAVEFELGSETCDVTCHCSNSFCWNCTEDSHRPVDCGTVSKWILKNNSEAESTNWILAYTKSCPKCNRPIEKSTGCMHMTCRAPCSHEFCWLCLRPWKGGHDGSYDCNRYSSGMKEGEANNADFKREMAKRSLQRYTHYYERWAANHSSRKKAIRDKRQIEDVKLEKLSRTQSEPDTQLRFIINAWDQIIECRRVLKWTYAYGYYLPENEVNKCNFFQYLQGEAEAGLERLHQCAEIELRDYYYLDSSLSFNDYRNKLVQLTKVTKNYFDNLVAALENGLNEVTN